MATTKVRGTQVSNVALLDAANIFTANQRVNAGLGINVAPPATGALALSGGITEYSRAVAQGVGINNTFNAGDYDSFDAGATITVTSGMVVYRYALIGKYLFCNFSIVSFSISGASGATTSVRVKLPSGITSAGAAHFYAFVNNNGGAAEIGDMVVPSGGTIFYIRRAGIAAYSNATTNTSIDTTFFVEIA